MSDAKWGALTLGAVVLIVSATQYYIDQRSKPQLHVSEWSEPATLGDGRKLTMRSELPPPAKLKWTLTDKPMAPAPVVIERDGELAHMLTVNGKASRVVIDLDTGKATITGDVNEAARTFWAAVSNLIPCKQTKGSAYADTH